jgi:hypothetical protein
MQSIISFLKNKQVIFISVFILLISAGSYQFQQYQDQIQILEKKNQDLSAQVDSMARRMSQEEAADLAKALRGIQEGL